MIEILSFGNQSADDLCFFLFDMMPLVVETASGVLRLVVK